jgi:hypothetical protein
MDIVRENRENDQSRSLATEPLLRKQSSIDTKDDLSGGQGSLRPSRLYHHQS